MDATEKFPAFYKVLYCSLDYSLVTLYIMLFMLFELLWGGEGNSLLSVFLVQIVEWGLRMLRSELGKKSLCVKAHVDERFMN